MDEPKTQEQIAKEAMDAIEKKEAESKGAAKDTPPEEKKTEEKEPEKKAEVEEPEKVKDKVEERKKHIQAEIDTIIAKKKAAEAELAKAKADLAKTEELKAEVEKLRNEKAELEKKAKPVQEKEEKDDELKSENERIAKYTEEDKEKPRAERREMSDDELDNWFLEEPGKAQRWVSQNELRRARERKSYRDKKIQDGYFNNLIKKQLESLKVLVVKHPELNTKEKEQALKAENKTDKEITEILCKENDKYRICQEIISDFPEYQFKENGPELIMAELEKRLDKKSEKPKLDDEEKERIRQEAAEEERQRQADIDEGITSKTRTSDKKPKKSEFQLEQERLAKLAGLKPEELVEMKLRRAKIPYADNVPEDKE